MDIKEINPRGDYGSKWGLTDFYEDFEEELRAAIAAKEPFEATWGAKKEIEYGQIEFDGETYNLSARTGTDEGYDLFDDAAWSICHWLNENVGTALRDGCELVTLFGIEHDLLWVFRHWNRMWNSCPFEDMLCSEYDASAELPGTATYEEIVAKLDELITETDNDSELNFDYLQESIWSFLEELTDPEFVAEYIDGTSSEEDEEEEDWD